MQTLEALLVRPKSRVHQNIMFSDRKKLELGVASINVCIIKGDLTAEKVCRCCQVNFPSIYC